MNATQLFGLAAAVGGIVAVILLPIVGRAVRRRRAVPGMIAFLSFLVAALFSVLNLGLLVGTRGYKALTHEELAAYIWTVPDSGQTFTAHAQIPGRTVQIYRVAGDELYVDAHILKWRPIGNLLGLHTQYELDRIGGRYTDLEDERARRRTVYSLGETKPFDLFDVRKATSLLAPLVDAEYGSATFTATPDSIAVWEVRVSTSGLLMRQIERRGAPPGLD